MESTFSIHTAGLTTVGTKVFACNYIMLLSTTLMEGGLSIMMSISVRCHPLFFANFA